MHSPHLFAALTLTTLTPGLALADDHHAWALSAQGPGAGQGALALSAGVLVLGEPILPTIGIDYVYGINTPVDVFLSTDLGFNTRGDFGVLGLLNFGVQGRATPGGGDVHFGGKLGPEILFAASGGGNGGTAFLLGVMPGLFLGGGSEAVQFTVGADVPMYFVGALAVGGASGAASGFSATIRPFLTVEGAISPSTALFLTACWDFALSGRGGTVYGQVMAGVSF